MLFNSKTGRVALEPEDMIRCKNANDAATLADILSKRQIPWELLYEKNGEKGIWIEILEEAADDK